MVRLRVRMRVLAWRTGFRSCNDLTVATRTQFHARTTSELHRWHMLTLLLLPLIKPSTMPCEPLFRASVDFQSEGRWRGISLSHVVVSSILLARAKQPNLSDQVNKSVPISSLNIPTDDFWWTKSSNY